MHLQRSNTELAEIFWGTDQRTLHIKHTHRERERERETSAGSSQTHDIDHRMTSFSSTASSMPMCTDHTEELSQDILRLYTTHMLILIFTITQQINHWSTWSST